MNKRFSKSVLFFFHAHINPYVEAMFYLKLTFLVGSVCDSKSGYVIHIENKGTLII